MKPVGSYLLIEIKKQYQDTVKYKSLELEFDPLYRPTYNLTIVGTVKAIPSGPIKDTWGQSIKPEINIGDEVYFRHVNSDEDTTLFASDINGENQQRRIPYCDVFCVVRDNKIIPVCGWILAKPFVEESQKTQLIINGKEQSINTKSISESLGLVGVQDSNFNKTLCTVEYISCFEGEETGLEPGDKVFGININYLNEINGEQFYCFREEFVLAKIM